jgi:alkylation response protein AidB-like acyl-CoA dehydrogenase
MDLLPNSEQAEIAGGARKLLSDAAGPAHLHALDPSAPALDRSLWQECAQLGWFGLGVAEADGGVGYTAAEESLLFREIGRALAAGPFVGTVLACHLAAQAQDKQLVTEIIEGRVRVGIVVASTDEQASAHVRGTFTTFDADDVSHFLVLGQRAALVAATQASVSRRPCFDLAARQAILTIDADAVLASDDSTLQRHAALLTAAMLSGIAEATRDDSVAFVKMREQFGAAIGTFQAVKHRCADAAVRADAATQLTSLAALSVAASTDDAGRLVESALRVSVDAALRNAGDNIQNHGGVGFSSEADAHLYLKRAHVLALSIGPPAEPGH